jgi:hypothetical protein
VVVFVVEALADLAEAVAEAVAFAFALVLISVAVPAIARAVTPAGQVWGG